MGLMPGARAQQKAAIANGVSARWVSLLCVASFCLGVFVIDRLWTIPDSVKNAQQLLAVEKHKSGDLHPIVKCENKETSFEAGDILSQVSQTHEVIMTLDRTISSLEMQLAAARAARVDNEKRSPMNTKSGSEQLNDRPRVFFVMGIITAFSSRKRRDSIRESWMPQGDELKRLEKDKGIIMRFVIGHSATSGGVLDRAIDAEDAKHQDFLRLVCYNFSNLISLILHRLVNLQTVRINVLSSPLQTPYEKRKSKYSDLNRALNKLNQTLKYGRKTCHWCLLAPAMIIMAIHQMTFYLDLSLP